MNSMENELAARRYLYHLLWFALADESGSEAVFSLGDSLAAKASAILGGEALKNACAAVGLACDALGSHDVATGKIRNEYSKTFIGPGKLPAYPWESIYVEKQPGLFLESTIAVRRAYAKHGLQLALLNAEPDDHVATELHFMALLSEETLAAFEASNEELVQSLVQDQVNFLDAHLGLWIGNYARALDESGQSPVFACLLAYATQLVRADRGWLDEFSNQL